MLTACFQVARLLRRLADLLAPRSGAHPRIVDCGAPLRRLCAAPDRCTRANPGHRPPRRCRGHGISGAKVWGEVPSDVLPIDRTFIDTSGAVLQVFDLTKLGGPPGGQVANAPPTYRATAGDRAGVRRNARQRYREQNTQHLRWSNSLFGLQIVSAEGVRLVKGEPGAQWMPGQFGVGGGRAQFGRSTAPPAPCRCSPTSSTTGRITPARVLVRSPTTLTPANSSQPISSSASSIGSAVRAGPRNVRPWRRRAQGRRPRRNFLRRLLAREHPEARVRHRGSVHLGLRDARRLVFAVAVANKRLYYSVEKPLQIWSVGIKRTAASPTTRGSRLRCRDRLQQILSPTSRSTEPTSSTSHSAATRGQLRLQRLRQAADAGRAPLLVERGRQALVGRR